MGRARGGSPEAKELALNVYLAVVLVYLGAIMGVAIYQSRRVKTKADFMVAGRSVPTPFLVATLVCTWIGSGSLFGGAGLAFRMGVGDLWMSAGAWFGIAVVMFLAARVRRIADYSVPELLERRYNATARLLGTLVVVVAYLTIAGYQFRGAGRLLNLVLPVDATLSEWTGLYMQVDGQATPLPWGAAISALTIMAFTALAGMVSIVSIDIFNGTLMIFGVFLALFLVVGQVGGWSEMVERLPPERFEVFAGRGPGWAFGYFFPTFFLLLGESSMYQKFLSAKNAIAARRAALGMVIGVVAIETALAFLAIAGAAKYQGLAPFFDGEGAVVTAKTEEIILHLGRFDLPPAAGCLLLAAGLAIIFSTGNTFLMVPALNLGHDVYKRFLEPGASEQEVVRLQRILIFVLGTCAFVVALFFKTILGMAYMAYTMVGAGLTPALLATFLWKRVTPQGAVASIVAGMVTVLVTNVFRTSLAGTFHWMSESDYDIYPAISASLLCLVGVSLATQPSPREKWQPFMSEAGRGAP
jgi:SSS family solute:Na+ symporter/sodium/proline symporter